jgi:glyoxylase-like metal-dependent hydrolase (beta-lactamase superfamily II)
MRRLMTAVALAAACLVVLSVPAATQQAPVQGGGEGPVKSLHVQGNIWMLVGPESNAAVSIGDEGVLVVDTMTEPMAGELLAEIRRIAGNKPIRNVVNTHFHPDHTGGNAVINAAGESIVAGNFAAQVGQDASGQATVYAHENMMIRMGQVKPPPPFIALPTNTFFTESKDFFFNGEPVQLLHQPSSHTDGDVVVFFRRSDVVVAGDVYNNVTFPVLRPGEGGGLKGVVDALNRIIDLTVPKEKQEGGTYVIPGHGRLADEADIVEYRDMNTIVRDRLQAAVDKGMTLDQVRVARLVRDYEGRYGATSGAWTTEQFVSAAYESLKK